MFFEAQDYVPGGSVKTEGLGDGSFASQRTIAKLRLTLPPIA